MPSTAEELVQLLDLEEVERGLYRGPQPRSLLQRTFGGQVLAQALVAAGRTVDESRRAHSLNAYFLRPGTTDSPMIYDVEVLRDGGAFSSRRVVARQDGTVKFAMNTSFHVEEPGLDHCDAMPTDVPPPEQCPTMAEHLARRYGMSSPHFREWDALEVRYVGDSGPGGSMAHQAHGAHMRVWVRTTGALPAGTTLHQAVLAYLSDLTLLSVSVVPHGKRTFSPDLQIASIDHAMWFHRPVAADRWMLYDQVSPSASNALGMGTGRIFQDGKLVASCAQEGLIRVVDPR